MPDVLQLTADQVALLRGLLAAHVPDVEVPAFGSRTNGRAHEGSDLDLVLRRRDDPSSPACGGGALREALRESTLPMLVDVHDWTLLPPAFRDEIARRHVVVQSVSGLPSRAAS